MPADADHDEVRFRQRSASAAIKSPESRRLLSAFFSARTHGEEGGGDNHSEKNEGEDKIMDHWGCSLMSGLKAVWSNHRMGIEKGT